MKTKQITCVHPMCGCNRDEEIMDREIGLFARKIFDFMVEESPQGMCVSNIAMAGYIAINRAMHCSDEDGGDYGSSIATMVGQAHAELFAKVMDNETDENGDPHEGPTKH